MAYPPLETKDLLYRREFEHDACGVGFVANISGQASHAILTKAIQAVINLTHRGAVSADAKTGDGAGVLTQIPHKLLTKEIHKQGHHLSHPRDLAVGMIFFPSQNTEAQKKCQALIEEYLTRYGLTILGWRTVPVNSAVLGQKAADTQPDIRQVLIGSPDRCTGEEYERLLYLVRKEIENRLLAEGIADCYIPSFSHRTIVYKGLFVATQLPQFYLDLQDPAFETALAVFHQRYSTNTFPNWFLAQPFRTLGHNGEINTLLGNRNWMRARQAELQSPVWGQQIQKLRPVIMPEGSDSANLDNVVELLVRSGRDIRHAFMMLIPEAWENITTLDPELKGFYQYHACLSEPWDGPAAIAFSDGIIVGATLDRNGLRPARYVITDEGLILMASEVGVLEIEQSRVREKGRLGPGQMIAVDTAQGRVWKNEEIKSTMARQKPYTEWVHSRIRPLDTPDWLPNGEYKIEDPEAFRRKQQAFGYTADELLYVLNPMFKEKKEPVGSMGDDTPLAVLSQKRRSLYTYFKQKFAQVTNPPIDSLREELVMSLNTYIGRRPSMLEESPEHAHLIRLSQPILFNHELEILRSNSDPAFDSITLSAVFPVADGPAGLEKALQRLFNQVDQAIARGKSIVILSDREVNKEQAPIPMLLAVSGITHHLIRTGQAMRADLIAETGDAWEVHHFATLLGYGAAAVNPYMAFQTIKLVLEEDEELKDLSFRKALENYRSVINKGLLKIMSKMGISTMSSYQGAQIFEAIGLNTSVIERYFAGTPSQIEGVGLEELATDVLLRHSEAYGNPPPKRLPDVGFYRFRKQGEQHAFSPDVVKALHKTVATGSYEDYKRYAELVNTRAPLALRDLFTFVERTPIPIEEVEPVESIRRRFTTQAMSLGALSPEAHRTIAIAMNRIGAKSNTGEGGEDPDWFHPFPNGDSANSKTKQVASGRFGVTPEYLARAEQLEIKMAQGSKPGEGGQLPGFKVAPHIARIRHSVPGVTLISPPPHHDIYSIEDLSQLIYDLKQVNPSAKVCVKLVAEAGVGTIAAGVAKGYADVIQISGHDGGTGASPISSIKNAGVPWELGLSETQQVLVLNDLRERVTLRVDGGMKTGRDVVIAAILGADEYGFGTAPVIATGCIMARQCHLNTCPVGVATQKEELRARFTGTPEMVIHFFNCVAQEVREILASLGVRKLEEIIGRSDLLRQVNTRSPEHRKAHTLNLSPILANPDQSGTKPRRVMVPANNRPEKSTLNQQILTDAKPALEDGCPVKLFYEIRNTDRTVGATLAGAIALKYSNKGLPKGTVELRFQGSAGQSFGAFCIEGMRLFLEGEANDYVGKGMGGGEIILTPPLEARFAWHQNIIMGNTVLYGATGGSLFAAGRAGERFCVRNSGAVAVVEGIGDHGCEYMTGGVVVVLGETGKNFGAGMSNGIAYVLDEHDHFPQRYNPDMVIIERLQAEEDLLTLHTLVQRHAHLTGSPWAKVILDSWESFVPLFWKVTSHLPEARNSLAHVMERVRERLVV